MTTVDANEVALGIESFGDDDAPLVLLAGGTTMLSWPDALCERLAAGGRRVVRYDLRDSGESTTTDPEAPAYTLRDLAADAAALADALVVHGRRDRFFPLGNGEADRGRDPRGVAARPRGCRRLRSPIRRHARSAGQCWRSGRGRRRRRGATEPRHRRCR